LDERVEAFVLVCNAIAEQDLRILWAIDRSRATSGEVGRR